jgi:cytochrome c
MMRLSTVSTLWDFIHRAMPWNAPRSLTVDQTFAVVAYILNLAEVVPDDFVLTDKNIAEVQKLMPNRNGMVMAPGLWHVKGKPDVNGSSCMSNCVQFVQIGSVLPPEVRNAQGNLAEQNRTFGPFIGVDTTKPPLTALPGAAGVSHASAVKVAKTPADLFKDNNCSACHAKSTKLVGPATDDVAAKYKGQSGAEEMLVKKVKNGGSGVWGSIPMPPQSDVSDETLHKLVHYVLTGE